MTRLPKKLAAYKGGATGPAPIEVADTIQSTGRAYVVDLLCEGEIEWLVNLYIDEAQYLNNSDFPTVIFNRDDYLRKGLPRATQALLPDRFSGAKVPIPVPQSNRIRKTRPITLYFNSNTYPDATSVLVNVKVPTLIRQVDAANKQFGETEGDVRENTVEYWVTLTENGVARAPIKEVIREKSSSGFIWSTRVSLNPDSSLNLNQWKIKIERISADGTSVKEANDTFLDSVIIETSYAYNYPNSAVAAVSFDAQNFPSAATRAYDLKLLKIKIPTGYTPTEFDDETGNVTAEAIYPAVWDGTFQTAKFWTNNPAWIFYDLLTNKRYGLGEYIPESSIDKWTLYKIAKYCDTLVDKGTGEAGLTGMEPRFACNLFLTTTEEAYTVINNLASVFRGITYWMSGKIFPVQDRPKESVQLFTNANALNGLFNYSSTGKGQRRTVCTVRWNDPADFYRPATETIEDPEGILRFGVRDFDIGAFACTSRGQAHRVGKWSLLSERLETEIVSFDTANEGLYSRPGDVIEIYDNFRYAQKQAGRVFDMNTSGTLLVLDRIIETGNGIDYSINLNIPKANRDPAYTGADTAQQVTSETHIDDIRKSFIEEKTITNAYYSGDKTVVNVNPGFSEQYIGGQWTITATNPADGSISGAKKYRVLNIKETEEKNISITALEYDETKFDITESGYTIRTSPTTDYGADPIDPPTSLSLNSTFRINGENFSAYILAAWTPSAGPFLALHEASGKKVSDSTWERLQVYDNGSKANFFPTSTGTYEVIVRAVQVGGAVSDFISGRTDFGASNPLGTSVIPMSGIFLKNHVKGNSGQYAERSPIFDMYVNPTGEIDQRRAFLDGIQFRFKNVAGSAVSDWFFVNEGESVVVPYNMPSITGWPMRSGIIEARAVDFWQNHSASVTLAFENPAPPISDLTIVSKDDNAFRYMITPTSRMPDDFSGVLFWTSTGQVRPSGYSIKSDTVGELTHNLNTGRVYVWWALADDFSFSGLNIAGPSLIDNGPLSFSTAGLTLALSGHEDDWRNQYNTLYATWDRVDSGDIRDYYIYLKESVSGALYTYLVPQPDSGSRPFFHFDSVIPDRTYSVALRARDGTGRKSALSAYSSGVFVPKPKIRYLQVEGRSYFFEPTNVRVHQQNVTADTSVFFDSGNIIRLNISAAGTSTITPVNIVSGATYLIWLQRTSNAATINFSSEFKWPDGEQPDLTTDAGAVDVISAFAINTGTLYAVAVNNLA
jgi:predicted phage tail protein